MLRPGDIPFILGQAQRSIRRSPGTNLASALCVGLSLLVLALAGSGGREVQSFTEAVRAEAEIVLFLSDDAGEFELRATISGLEAMLGVRDVNLVDIEEARTRMEDVFGEAVDFSAFGDLNPCQRFLEVGVDPASADAVARRAADLPGVDAVRDNRELLSRLVSLGRFLNLAVAAFILAVLFMTAVVVSHIVRLGIHQRRHEIETLRLLGAEEWFVRAPFVAEGLMISCAGGLLAVGGLWLALPVIYGAIAESLPFLPLIGWERLAPTMTGVLLLTSAGAGLVGTLIALRSPRGLAER